MLCCALSHVRLFATPWTTAHKASSVCGILQARRLEWVAMSFSRGSSRPSDRTHISCISCIGRQVLCHWAIWEASFQDRPQYKEIHHFPKENVHSFPFGPSRIYLRLYIKESKIYSNSSVTPWSMDCRMDLMLVGMKTMLIPLYIFIGALGWRLKKWYV